MKIGARSVAILLSPAWCWVCCASAHLPQLFGLEYVRAEVRPGSAQADGAAASPPAGEQGAVDGSDDSALERRIAESEDTAGPYAVGLVDPLLSAGSRAQAQGDYREALQAYQRALHVVRINDGLTSEYQIPALRRLMTLYRDTGDYERLHHAYTYLFRLRTLDGPPYRSETLDDSLEYFSWQRHSYAAPGGVRRESHLLRAYQDNRRLLDAAAATADTALDGYRRLAFSQIHNLYLILGIDPHRLQSGGLSPEQDGSDEMARHHLLRIQDIGLYEGSGLLEGLIGRSRGAQPEELAALHLELGDWYQWNESQGRAREQYREVERLLRSAGREDLLARWLGEPVELPDESETWLAPAVTVGGSGVVRARYRVTGGGDVRDLETVLRDGGDGPGAGRVARMLRDTHFRPRFSDGAPRMSGEVTRYYRLVER